MFLLYSLLFSLGLVLAAPYYLWRGRGKGLMLADWRERFGFLSRSFQGEECGALWVHAVSVGETLAVVGLVRELQHRYPERKIFLSHVTPAGREVGEKRLRSLAGRFYLPLDWGWAVRRVLRRLRPALLLIAETELWPNLLRVAHECGARTVLVNARLSERSFRRYGLVRPFMRRVLENVDRICVQTPADAERYKFLGARPERVVVTGNIKFDVEPPQGAAATPLKEVLKRAQRIPVLVAASTMPGEESLLLRAWQEIQRVYPRALLILAPRHPARFEAVAKFLAGNGRSFIRRTALEAGEQGLGRPLASSEIFLLDTIGELAGIFELADVVFVGGSLVPTGGHNPLEPAFWSKPIVFGPAMDNFRDVAELFLAAHAAVQVRDTEEFAQATLQLFADDAYRRRLGEAARKVLDREAGATRRILEGLREWLEAGVPGRARA